LRNIEVKLCSLVGTVMRCRGTAPKAKSRLQGTARNCPKFATKGAFSREFCTAKFAHFEIFCAAQSIGCRRYDRHACPYAHIWRAGLQLPSAALRCVLAFNPSTREVAAVDLALKLNVLAVCAVFAFVGAILLGAF
jgi:hypothetical protein